MNKLTFNVLIILLSGFLLLTACKNEDDDPSPEEINTLQLMGTWIVGEDGSVSRDDIPSDEWIDFTLTFGENTYSTTNTYHEVWPTQGVWSFVGDNFNQIAREDGLVIDIEVTETTLTMVFIKNESNETSRIKGVSGEYTFILKKQ